MHLTHCHDVPALCQTSAALTAGLVLFVCQALRAPRILFCTYIQGKDKRRRSRNRLSDPTKWKRMFFPFCVAPLACCFLWRRRVDQLWRSQALRCIFSSVTAVYATLMCHAIILGSPAPQMVSLIPQSALQVWLTALFEVYLCCLKSWLLVWNTHPPGIICQLWFQTQFRRRGVYCMEML